MTLDYTLDYQCGASKKGHNILGKLSGRGDDEDDKSKTNKNAPFEKMSDAYLFALMLGLSRGKRKKLPDRINYANFNQTVAKKSSIDVLSILELLGEECDTVTEMDARTAIEEYVNWKVVEEQKVAALVAGSKLAEKHLTQVLAACTNWDGAADSEDRFLPRANPQLMDELGRVLLQVCGAVPDGVVAAFCDRHGVDADRLERAREDVADLALALGAEHVERRARALERELADLRPVAVREHDLVLLRERRDRGRHVLRRLELVLDRQPLASPLQRVAAHRHDDPLARRRGEPARGGERVQCGPHRRREGDCKP